jgi:two-component sensor histidine kinase
VGEIFALIVLSLSIEQLMNRQKQYPKKILARATLDEHRRLVDRAKAADLSLSRFVIECGLTLEVASREDRSQRERALREIRRVGNNLNQIAHQMNMQTGTVDHSEVQRALIAVREVLQMMGVLWGRR